MTNQKHLKSRVRERMAKTGERYAAARSSIVAADRTPPTPAGEGHAAHHLAGIHPETTAVRILARAAGMDVSEALALVVAGGIGAGAFAFHYPQFSSLYLTGRHGLDDSAGFVASGLARLGVEVTTAQTSGAPAARRNLAAALEAGPVIAWCDFVELGTRGVPELWSGGGYHVVTVYGIDPADGTATIGDLRPEPEPIDAERWARARGRIAKDKTRVMGITSSSDMDLVAATRAGLAACVDGFRNPRSGSFGLGAWTTLARRMRAPSGKDAWITTFPRGRWLWVALRSIYEYVETDRTGGGLMRPMFATGLAEAAAIAGDGRLQAAADRYAEIGRAWTALARVALRDDVPLFAEARAILDAREKGFKAGAAAQVLRDGFDRQDRLGDAAAEAFPLTEAEVADLLGDLSGRLDAIVAAEAAALAELEAVVTS